MKKTLLFLIITCFTISTFYAQVSIEGLKINYGKTTLEKKYDVIKIIGEDNNHVFTLGLRSKKYAIILFDSENLDYKKTVPFELPKINNKPLDIEDVFYIDGNFQLIASKYYKSEKNFKMFGFQIDESGKLSNDKKALFSTKAKKNKERGNFYFSKSVNLTSLTVLHQSISNRDDALTFEIKIFDKNLNEMISKKEVIEFDTKKKREFSLRIEDFDTNRNNDIHLVVNEGYRDKSQKQRVEKFKLISYKKENNYAKEETLVNINDKVAINCSLVFTNDNKIKLFGYFSDTKSNGKSEFELTGIYTAVIDGDDINVTTSRFDKSTIAKILGERRANKGKSPRPLYYIKNIIEEEDGGIIIISEFSAIVVGQSSGALLIKATPITYINNEIIVSKISKDGEHVWSNVIPKKQYVTATEISLAISFGGFNENYSVAASFSIPLGVLGKGPEFISYIPLYKDGKLSILFNDHFKNKGITELKKVKKMVSYKRTNPALFNFEKDGSYVRKDSEEFEREKMVIRPLVSRRVDDSESLIYGSFGDKSSLGNLILE